MSRKLTVTKVAAALKLHSGNLTQAALACGVARMTFYRFLADHAELEELRSELNEVILDKAESQVIAAINAGDMKTIRWFLDRVGKERGYTTRIETTGKDGAPLNPMAIRREIVDPAEEADA